MAIDFFCLRRNFAEQIVENQSTIIQMKLFSNDFFFSRFFCLKFIRLWTTRTNRISHIDLIEDENKIDSNKESERERMIERLNKLKPIHIFVVNGRLFLDYLSSTNIYILQLLCVFFIGKMKSIAGMAFCNATMIAFDYSFFLCFHIWILCFFRTIFEFNTHKEMLIGIVWHFFFLHF